MESPTESVGLFSCLIHDYGSLSYGLRMGELPCQAFILSE
jgi:hypothetical protein